MIDTLLLDKDTTTLFPLTLLGAFKACGVNTTADSLIVSLDRLQFNIQLESILEMYPSFSIELNPVVLPEKIIPPSDVLEKNFICSVPGLPKTL